MRTCLINASLTSIHSFVGQLVSYMREHSLKYGFLTTYSKTIFVKRSDSYRFLLSDPIDEKAARPSVRECFAGFSVLAAEDPSFVESESVTAKSVSACFYRFAIDQRLMGYSVASHPCSSSFTPLISVQRSHISRNPPAFHVSIWSRELQHHARVYHRGWRWYCAVCSECCQKDIGQKLEAKKGRL